MLLRFLRWFADLPLTIVATSALLAGLVRSSTEAAKCNGWGHYGLLAATVPIVCWLVMQGLRGSRLTARQLNLDVEARI